jgi:hypothetical protein
MRPKTIELFTDDSQSTQKYIPQYNNNLLLFTTFDKDNKIKSTKWFDEDVDTSNENTMAYLSFTNSLEFLDDAKKNVKVVKLKNIELKGPLALYFANDKNTYEISEFTVIFMLNFKNITGSHTLFEMLCNTGVKNDSPTTNPQYVSQVISINITNVSQTNVRLSIIIGEVSASTGDIDINLMKSDRPVLISLSYDKSKQTQQVHLKIDKHTSEKFNIEAMYMQSIYASTAPVIINKAGEIDCEMYSMAYYTKTLTDAEIDEFRAFNEYYINGISQYDKQSAESKKAVADAEKNQKENARKLSQLQSSLEKCISYKSERSTITGSSGSGDSSSDLSLGTFDITLPSAAHRNILGF